MNKPVSSHGVVVGTSGGTRVPEPDAQARRKQAEWNVRAEWERVCKGWAGSGRPLPDRRAREGFRLVVVAWGLITGETTIVELQAMLSRLGDGASVCVGMDSDGDWSATHYVGSEPTYSMTAGTLAEALSALLSEIPEVNR